MRIYSNKKKNYYVANAPLLFKTFSACCVTDHLKFWEPGDAGSAAARGPGGSERAARTARPGSH